VTRQLPDDARHLARVRFFRESQKTETHLYHPLFFRAQPNKITVAKGETIEFVNNKAFPHNVVFDEDNVPSGVNADAISHEDYLNGPGEKVTNKFDTPGTYGYYCEPHQGAGMQGTIIVQ
jgi:plastocyanin